MSIKAKISSVTELLKKLVLIESSIVVNDNV